MLVDSIGYLKKGNNSVNADIKKAQIRPYVNYYLNDFSSQSFANNMDVSVVKNQSDSLVGKFLNFFA
ncbi:hypothetical protein J6I39_06600 [bacterium]|nr:hypothetical protein [bacterium]